MTIRGSGAIMRQRYGWVVVLSVLVTGSSMLGFGFWAWISPDSFAQFTGFETHTHYLHDAGVFQIGIGAALLLSLAFRDATTVTLAAFAIANTLHTINHWVDLHIGGEISAVYALGVLSLIGAIALAVRLTALRHHSGLPAEPTQPTLGREDHS